MLQTAYRGGNRIHILVLRMESADMPGDIGTGVFYNKAGKLFQLIIGIVLSGHQQRRNLKPDARLFRYVADSIQHRLQSRLAQPLVIILAESLQVDVDPVEPAGREVYRLGRHITVTDENVRQAAFLCQASAIVTQPHKNRRLGIGVSHAPATAANSRLDNLLRSDGFTVNSPVLDRGLADLPVLTKLTATITAHRRNRETARAGLKMKQRLF